MKINKITLLVITGICIILTIWGIAHAENLLGPAIIGAAALFCGIKLIVRLVDKENGPF